MHIYCSTSVVCVCKILCLHILQAYMYKGLANERGSKGRGLIRSNGSYHFHKIIFQNYQHKLCFQSGNNGVKSTGISSTSPFNLSVGMWPNNQLLLNSTGFIAIHTIN